MLKQRNEVLDPVLDNDEEALIVWKNVPARVTMEDGSYPAKIHSVEFRGTNSINPATGKPHPMMVVRFKVNDGPRIMYNNYTFGDAAQFYVRTLVEACGYDPDAFVEESWGKSAFIKNLTDKDVVITIGARTWNGVTSQRVTHVHNPELFSEVVLTSEPPDDDLF